MVCIFDYVNEQIIIALKPDFSNSLEIHSHPRKKVIFLILKGISYCGPSIFLSAEFLLVHKDTSRISKSKLLSKCFLLFFLVAGDWSIRR